MEKHHPSYLKEPLHEDLAREHFLHRLVAASAFLFALCILPVAQYFLVGTHNGGEIGQVAGVSTEAPASPALAGVVTSPGPTSLLDCVQQKQQDEADLARFQSGEEKALLNTYEKSADPLHTQLLAIQGTSQQDQDERNSLQKQLDDLSTNYNKQLAAIETAVADQKVAIDSRVCPQ